MPPVSRSRPATERADTRADLGARTLRPAQTADAPPERTAPPERAAPPDPRPKPRLLAVKRVALATATVVASINIWTGSPLLALWVGSKTVPSSGLSMTAVFVVIAVLAASVLTLTAVLGWLSARYDQLTGRPAAARRTSPWLRSMRGEREEVARKRQGISPIERIVVLSVTSAVVAFEVWFFFFAGSSLPNGP